MVTGFVVENKVVMGLFVVVDKVVSGPFRVVDKVVMSTVFVGVTAGSVVVAKSAMPASMALRSVSVLDNSSCIIGVAAHSRPFSLHLPSPS